MLDAIAADQDEASFRINMRCLDHPEPALARAQRDPAGAIEEPIDLLAQANIDETRADWVEQGQQALEQLKVGELDDSGASEIESVELRIQLPSTNQPFRMLEELRVAAPVVGEVGHLLALHRNKREQVS